MMPSIRRLLFLLGSLPLFTALPAMAEKARPHLFIYLSDDHSYFDTSLFGAEDCPTPEMERLAADGMSFTHAFVASPACAPSRAAMLTGLMPARNGAEANHTQPGSEIASLVETLREEGYTTAAFGKVAHGKNPKRYGFDHLSAARQHAELKREVTAYLEEQPEEDPVAIFVGTSNPHVPWPMENEVDPASLKLPPIHLDTPLTRAERAAYVQEIIDLDALLGALRAMAAEQLGENVIFLHTSDHGSQWPFGKWNLYDYGTRVPFLISWPGVIEPGTVSDAMISWVDLLPTLIDAVGGEVPDGIDGRSFLPVLRGEQASLRDRIFTTHSGDGNKNIYPIRAIRTADWKLIHNLRPDLAHTNHSDLLRKVGAGTYWNDWTEEARNDAAANSVVIRYFSRPEWELFHVSEDPWERDNRIEDPDQQERIESLKRELAEWRKSQGDTSELFNEPRPLNRPETWHPDQFGRHEGIELEETPKKRKQ